MKLLLKIFLLVILFSLLGIIFSYPLVLHFDSALPYTHSPAPGFEVAQLMQGDHLILYYVFWLCKDYFISGNQKFFQEPYAFSVLGQPKPYEPKGIPSSFIFLLLSILGNITACNLLTLLSFILCGLSTFFLSKKYLGITSAAIISSIIFSVSPFRLAQLFGGHPTGYLLFWIPLIIYLYELLWEKRKWIYGCLAGISIFLVTIEEHHLGYYMALFTIAFWGHKFYFCNKKDRIGYWKFTKLISPVFLGWAVTLLYMIYVKLTVFGASIAGSGRTYDEIKLYAPTIGSIFQRINPVSEKYIYIGIAASILFLIGICKRASTFFKKEYIKDSFPYLFYLLTFGSCLILSLGPNLKYFPIYKLCYKIIPFFHYPRSPGRISVYAMLALSLLAGYGVKIIITSIPRKAYRFIATSLIILVICLDFHPYPRIGLSRTVSGNKTYEHIKDTSPNNSILEIPVWPGDSSWTSIYQYYTTIYRIPLINGYSPFVTRQYIDQVFWPLASINMGILTKTQYELLKKLNVKYINLHEEAYPQKVSPFPFKIALENLKRSPYVKFILHDDPMYLFQIVDRPLTHPSKHSTIPSKTGVFYECEYMPHRTGIIIEDTEASNNKSIFAQPPLTEPAHLIFGPWQMFPPGRYKVIFRAKLKNGSSQDKVATLEVTTDKGQTRIAYSPLPIGESLPAGQERVMVRGYKDYMLQFTLDKLTTLEFRIIYYGGCPIWCDYVYLLCQEETDPVWHYEAEELFHTGREIDNAVFVTPELDPEGIMVFGPYRRYPPGRYRVGFRLRADKKSHKPVATIEVTSGYSEKPFIKKVLKDISTEYKTCYLDINLNKPTVLEFRVGFLREVPIYVDYIKIEPI